MDNVRKKAGQLAAAILNSPEYKKLNDAREKIENHQAAQMMLKDFQEKQLALHKQQMEGTPATPEQEEQLQSLFGVISINPYIRELLEAEFAFSGLMLEVNNVLSEALGLKGEDEEEEDLGPKIETPAKKILIPGKDI